MRTGDGLLEFARPAVVLVEGEDDQHFVTAAVTGLGLGDVLQVVHARGKDRLGALLHGLDAIDGFDQVQAVGVIRDAEEDHQATWRSTHDALRNSSWLHGEPPARPGEIVDRAPSVGVLLLPPDGRDGALESVVLDLMGDRPERSCVDHWLDCLADVGFAAGNVAEHDKRALRALLLAQPRHKGKFLLLTDAVRLNHERSFWNWHDAALEAIKQFLRDLAATAGRAQHDTA